MKLLDRIIRSVGPTDRTVRVGPGDDCAVLTPKAGRALVVSVDAQVEGSHFRAGWLTAGQLGYRAAMASLSDLAAMGAAPWVALVSAVVPRMMSGRDVLAQQRGIDRALRRFGATSVGGNLVRSETEHSVSTTVIGTASPAGSIARRGARPGHDIWLSGIPGRAALGLAALEAGRASGPYVTAFRRPLARIELGAALARAGVARAMIDVSDGLSQDLDHLIQASGGRVGGAELDWRALRPSPSFVRTATSLGVDARGAVLGGGEDYELLFAARPADAAQIERCAKRLAVRVRRIGRCDETEGLWLLDRDRRERIRPTGYVH